MTEEKNSLLSYLLGPPKEETKVFCREMQENRDIKEFTYGDLLRSTYNFGRVLKDNNELGKHIPMILDTSFDFLRIFFGIIAGKKVCIPIHTTANADAISHILNKVSAESVIVTQPWLYKKLVSLDYVHKHIHTIFCTPEVMAQKALPCKHIDIIEILSKPSDLNEAKEHITQVVSETKPDDTMQIVFTSGTTGEPKGAVLSHKNMVSCVVRAGNFLGINHTYRTLTFLPLSHVMAQNEVFIAFIKKAIIQIVDRNNLLHGLKTLEPNILVSVPRVYQAVHDGIFRKLRNKPKTHRLLSYTVQMHVTSKTEKSFFKRMLARLYCKTLGNILTSKVRNNVGKFEVMVTAGGACPPHIYDFFEAIGLPLTNAQGLTEVSGAIVYNDPGKTHECSIGYPLPGVDVKIDDDGEILIKGDPVFSGYFEEYELNQLSFNSEGYFKSGDLGRIEHINGKDYIFLLGRKKEIVVLSSGHNIPPVQIEEKLLQHEMIHQVVVIGDGRPRLSALIVPEDEHCKNPDIREEISKIIKQVNRQMDSMEKISQFEIIPEPFTVENGMLTPTMKVRRLAVSKRYEEVIGQLYTKPNAC